jgi:hypothetical protein
MISRTISLSRWRTPTVYTQRIPVATINPEVIVCNIKKRFTGVSGTINALVPVQARDLALRPEIQENRKTYSRSQLHPGLGCFERRRRAHVTNLPN